MKYQKWREQVNHHWSKLVGIASDMEGPADADDLLDTMFRGGVSPLVAVVALAWADADTPGMPDEMDLARVFFLASYLNTYLAPKRGVVPK